MIKINGILVTLALVVSNAHAEEVLRPYRHSDLDNPSVEMAHEVKGAEVVWMNRFALERDFNELKGLSDPELKSWLIKNTSYVGARQPLFDRVQNTPIPLSGAQKALFRSPVVAGVGAFEVQNPKKESQSIGLISVKGVGHGADESQVDGLIGLGEASAELTRQRVVQNLFDLHGMAHETVEGYAIIKLPFLKITPETQEPAALYLRQAVRPAESITVIPRSILIDHSGSQRLVDFRDVVITSKYAGPLFETDERVKPQQTIAWRRAHDVAMALATDPEALEKHIREVVGPIQEVTDTSSNWQIKESKRSKIRAVIQSAQKAGQSLAEIKAMVLEPTGGETAALKRIAEELRSKDQIVRRQAIEQLFGRTGPSALGLVEQGLYDKNSTVRRMAALALMDHKEPYAVTLIERLLRDNDDLIVASAVRALSGRSDAKSMELIEKAFDLRGGLFRPQALEALVGRNDAYGFSLIEDALKDDSEDVRIAAIQALRGRSEVKILNFIRRVLNDDSVYVRRAAIKSLWGLRDTHSLALIQRALQDDDSYVRASATLALSGRSDDLVLNLIDARLKDSSIAVRQAAAEVLVGRKEKAAKKLLKDYLRGSYGGRVDYKIFKTCPELLGPAKD
jgi:HEAT repeat protein